MVLHNTNAAILHGISDDTFGVDMIAWGIYREYRFLLVFISSGMYGIRIQA